MMVKVHLKHPYVSCSKILLIDLWFVITILVPGGRLVAKPEMSRSREWLQNVDFLIEQKVKSRFSNLPRSKEWLQKEGFQTSLSLSFLGQVMSPHHSDQMSQRFSNWLNKEQGVTVEGFQIAFFWAPEKGPYDSFPVEPIIYESYLDLFGCIYMTNNVKSCQKINGFTEIFGDFSPEERVEEACKEENPQVAIHLMPNSRGPRVPEESRDPTLSLNECPSSKFLLRLNDTMV